MTVPLSARSPVLGVARVDAHGLGDVVAEGSIVDVGGQRRVARFWSADGGVDDRAIDALRERRPDRVAIVEPTPQDLASQLTTELEVSPRHLRTTLDRYWDREWRRAHRVPEDHLWRAASAVADMTKGVGLNAHPRSSSPPGGRFVERAVNGDAASEEV
jgi:hypothetical protein